MQTLPRTLVIVALVGALLACVGGLVGMGTATREAATARLAARSLDELALLAGLADDEGKLLRDEPMPVVVIADGGPMWTLSSVGRAVASSPYFAEGDSPHLLRSEIIDERAGIALQLHLWRNGWELREPVPARIRIAPWAAVLAGLLGAGLALWTRRLSYGLALAGLLGQLLLALDPLPRELFPPQSLLEAWAGGPLVGRVLDGVRGLGSLELSAIVALGAGSLVLAAFDHRRTRGREQDLGFGTAASAALLGSVGAIAWVEVASRGALLAACDLRFGAWGGCLALLGLILAWLPAIRGAREAWRARAS